MPPTPSAAMTVLMLTLKHVSRMMLPPMSQMVPRAMFTIIDDAGRGFSSL